MLQNIEYIESIQTIQRQANTDYLTKLYNRRYFFENSAPKVKKLHNAEQASTLAMMDIDFFKSVNDTYGHDAGDLVLKSTAKLIEQHFGHQFIAARIGGEEFSVYFDNLPLEQAKQKLNAFREEYAQIEVNSGSDKIRCTVSIGVISNCESNIDDLVNKADELLYEAKESGRNRVVSELSGMVIPENRPTTARSGSRNNEAS